MNSVNLNTFNFPTLMINKFVMKSGSEVTEYDQLDTKF